MLTHGPKRVANERRESSDMVDMRGMPVATASVSWVDSDGTRHTRVYSCDGYIVTERCNDGASDWYTGKFRAPGAEVSAAVWQDPKGTHLRVYCTVRERTVEYRNDPDSGWSAGS